MEDREDEPAGFDFRTAEKVLAGSAVAALGLVALLLSYACLGAAG